MKNKSIIIGIIILFISSNFTPIISGNTSNSINDKTIENKNPILQFYFDEQNKTLYLTNIGNETAYNISIKIQIDGFIIFGFGNTGFQLGIDALNPGEEKDIIKIFPLVIGLGPIDIIYTAIALNTDSTSITLKAFLIGFFIFNLRL